MTSKFYRRMQTESQIRTDERNKIADMIRDTAFHVFVDTDGCRSIKVHEHYKGLELAEKMVREL